MQDCATQFPSLFPVLAMVNDTTCCLLPCGSGFYKCQCEKVKLEITKK